MNTDAAKIIDALGGTAQVSRLFGVRMPSVSRWKFSGIPAARMMYLQVARPDALAGVNLQAATAHACEVMHKRSDGECGVDVVLGQAVPAVAAIKTEAGGVAHA